MNPSVSGNSRLQPVAENIYHEGAPFVPLSPHKGLRNACVLYDAIKELPDKTLIRGDFNKKSVPFVYFPERPKRKIIGASQPLKGIAGKNIETGRKELAGFVHSIVDSARTLGQSDHQLTLAKMNLNSISFQVTAEERDFSVGDIKEPLKKLANAYLLQNVRKLTSPHRLLPKQGSSIQDKRMQEFVHMGRAMYDDLAEALRPKSPYHNNKYDTTSVIAVYEMKMLFKDYLLSKKSAKKPFSDFMRKHGIAPQVAYFAKRWLEISLPTQNDERIKFSTEPWAKELDRICPLIIKEQRRSSRILPTVSNDEASNVPGKVPGEVQLEYRLPIQVNLSPLPSLVDVQSKSESGKVDDNNKPPQPQLNALSPDTPDDEFVWNRLFSSLEKLTKFNLDIPYSSIQLGQPSSRIAEEPQIVVGHPIGASAQELPLTIHERAESSSGNEPLTDQVTDNCSESFSDFSTQASEDDAVTEALPKSVMVMSDSFRSTDTTSSSNLFSTGSRSVLSPERSTGSSFTQSQKIGEVPEISSTDEDD